MDVLYSYVQATLMPITTSGAGGNSTTVEELLTIKNTVLIDVKNK